MPEFEESLLPGEQKEIGVLCTESLHEAIFLYIISGDDFFLGCFETGKLTAPTAQHPKGAPKIKWHFRHAEFLDEARRLWHFCHTPDVTNPNGTEHPKDWELLTRAEKIQAVYPLVLFCNKYRHFQAHTKQRWPILRSAEAEAELSKWRTKRPQPQKP